jgi:hypothetical protein
MAEDHKRYTVPRGNSQELHTTMDRIKAGGEDAIVQDQNQSYWGDGAQSSSAKGDYYDVWAGGELIDSTDSKADAERSLREHRNQHPKQ